MLTPSLPNEQSEIVVEREDREAAAAVTVGRLAREDILAGLLDKSTLVQAFAHHRIQALARASAPTGEVEEHGDWLIWHQPLPVEWRGADWHFARKDASDNIDIGDEESREMCLQTIDWLEEQDREAETEAGQARTQKFVDNGMRILNRALLARAVKNLLDLPGIGNLPGFMTGTHIEAARYALAQYEEQTA